MLVKNMVVSKKRINIISKKLFSLQLKEALFYSFIEAKKQGLNIVDSQLLLYGLLRVNTSLTNRLIKQLYSNKSLSFNAVEKLLLKLKLNFKKKTKSKNHFNNSDYPNFSRPVRRLLFFLIRSKTSEKVPVLTTIQVLNYLLRHKYVSTWIRESLLQNS